jgi:protease-4
MLKFLIGLATGILLTFVTLFLIFFIAVRLRERPPSIADNSVLVLNLEGDLPEKPPVEIPFLPTPGPSVTMTNAWMALRKAVSDPHIKAIVLMPEGLSMGWAKLEELRSGIERFRRSGKLVYAYLRVPGSREYYLATAADRIYLGPQDLFYVKGLRAEMMYFRNTLDKLGAAIEIEHAGKYKDFGDTFTRTGMSPETREVMNSLLDDLYGNFITRIAESRKKSADEVRAIIDSGPFLAREAKAAGLIDELQHEDQMWGDLRTKLGSGEPRKVPLGRYVKTVSYGDGKNYIALVVGEGEIIRGDPSDDGSEEVLTSYGFNKLLKRVANDAMIKGVVVRIDSPGGDSVASDEIWREMNQLSRKKPLVISMSDAAASGGYYIAMTGDPVVAYPGTVTGSIGVVFGKANLHGLYNKLGITKDWIQRGRYADIDSDYKPLEPDERAKLRQGIEESYRDFVSKVAEGRRRPFAEVEPLSQGRVWLGSQAKTRGLVDELGGLDRAIALVKQKAKIPAEQQIHLLTYPPRRTLIEVLLRRSQEDVLETRIQSFLNDVPVRAWMKGGLLRLAPYSIDIR